FPIRMLLPGWVGIGNIKWVGRIEVSEKALYLEWNTKKYVMIGPDYKPNPPALGPVLTAQKVKSAFELPWNGEITLGKRLLLGRGDAPDHRTIIPDGCRSGIIIMNTAPTPSPPRRCLPVNASG